MDKATRQIQEIFGSGASKEAQELHGNAQVLKPETVVQVEMVTIKKRVAEQLDIIWSPTRSLFEDAKVYGRIKGHALSNMSNNGNFLLAQLPEPDGRLVLVRVHLATYEQRIRYPLIIVK